MFTLYVELTSMMQYQYHSELLECFQLYVNKRGVPIDINTVHVELQYLSNEATSNFSMKRDNVHSICRTDIYDAISIPLWTPRVFPTVC